MSAILLNNSTSEDIDLNVLQVNKPKIPMTRIVDHSYVNANENNILGDLDDLLNDNMAPQKIKHYSPLMDTPPALRPVPIRQPIEQTANRQPMEPAVRQP